MILKLFRPVAGIKYTQYAIEVIAIVACMLLGYTSLALAQSTAIAPSQEKLYSGQAVLLDQAQSLVEVQGAVGRTVERSLVQLPYHWDKMHAAHPGQAEFEIAFELPGEPSEPHAVFVPRVGNRFELWLNGVLISRGGEMDDLRADFGKIPRYFAIPPSLLQKSNLFRIKLQADGGRRAGLMPMLFGPELEVRTAYEQAYQFRTSSALAVFTLMLVLAAVSASLWFTQLGVGSVASVQAKPEDQRDPLYAYAALAAATWSLRLSDQLIERSILPWPLWGVITGLALGTSLLCLYGLLIYIAKAQDTRRAQRYLQAIPALCGASALASAGALYLQLPWLLSAWYVLLWLFGVALVSWFVWRTFQAGDADMRVMSGALLLNLLVTASDLWRFRVSSVLSDNSWASLASAAYALAVFYIVISRFRRASVQARDLRNNLEARVAQREAELAQSYAKLDQLSREQAKSEERTRILRDMHDGVGAHISAAIRQVEHGQGERSELLQTLRDSLDQLKLSIDAMHLQAGDVTALLANLRYRLEPRLKSSGIELQWAVQMLPEQPQLDHAALRQLQFMLFEAFSNVLQHSGASQLQLSAVELEGCITIALRDNGRGFDPAQPSRGLASMRERAKAIGADVKIHSRSGQTVVEISIVSAHNALF